MLDDEPRAFFAHFWANDDAVKLAKGSGPDWTWFTSRPKADSGTAVTIRLVFVTLTVVALEKLDGR
jgi:hypothetical protein